MNDVFIALKISGFTFSHDYLTDVLELSPTEIHSEGELFYVGPPHNMIEKKYEKNNWEYRIHIERNSVWVKEIIDQFIKEVMLARKDRFEKIKNSCKLELYVGLYFRDIEINGLDSFQFNSQTLLFMGQLNIALEIDQYSFRNETKQ